MAAIIQFRRDTAANWTSENPTLADGEFALESDTTKYKIGDGSTVWTSLAYGGLGSIDTALIDAKGDLVGGTADNTVGKLTVGSNGQVLVADSSATTGLKWVTNESIVNWHEAVKLGTAAVLPNSPTYSNGTAGVGATLTAGSQVRLVVDGANATTGDRVLVQDQASALQNGIYDVTAQGASGSAAWILTRAVDFDGAPTGQIKQGESAYVLAGSNNVGQGFVVTTTSDPHVVGTNDITFTQFTGTQAFTAGTYLTISGNTINHDNSGASAGSYGSATQVATLTTDAQGHLTAVSNTTIAIPSTAVTDFTEAVQDVAGAQVATNGSHTGIAATYDDAGDGAVDLTLTVSGVSAAAYGSATQVPGYTVDTYGRLTTAANTTIAIPSTAVTDFTEAVQDVSGAQLATNGTHTGITAAYDDAGDGAIDLALVTENVQDISGAQLATNGSHTGITATYDDAGDGAIDLALVTENVQDITGAQIATNGSHTGIAASYDDGGDGAVDLTLTASGASAASYGSATQVPGYTVDTYGRLTAASNTTIAIPSTAVTDFSEAVQDVAGAQLATNGSHTGLTATYDDAGDGAVDLKVTEIHDADGDSKVHWSSDDVLSLYINGGNRATITQTSASFGSMTGRFGTSLAVLKDDNGAAAGPIFYLERNTTTQADDDLLGQIQFVGADDSPGNDNLYGYITGVVQDASAGAEDGIIRLSVSIAGTGTDIVDVMESGVNLATGKGVLVAGTSILTATSLAATVVLANGVAATTQSASDNSTKVATTAYVDTGLGALSSDSITDADANTKIQVEESADENIIRFDTAGTERMSIAADGTVTIVGNLVVNGTETTISSTTITVDDKNIEIGSVASPSDTTADGGGLTLKGATDKTWNWVNSTDAWTSSEHVALATGKSVYIDGVLQLSKNALAATVVLADGVIATTQSANDSSTKVATTAFVMTEIGDYAPLASPTLTGVPAAPTAAADTSTTQIATTAFVMTEVGDYLLTATAASTYAPLASPTLTGVPAAPTAAADTNTTQIATTAYVQTELGALSSDSITDADGDTKIQVEESSDEDKIRFDIAGTEVAVLDANDLDIAGNIKYDLDIKDINESSGTTYTMVADDRGKLLRVGDESNNTSANTITIPTNTAVPEFTIGTQIQVAAMGGEVTMATAGTPTLRYTPGLKLRDRYSSCTCIKIATDEWLLVGDLEA